MRAGNRPKARGSSRRKLAREIQLLRLPNTEGVPLHSNLYRQLREHILRGALRPGERIPSGRALAADLGLSRNTVETAVSQLVAEGFVVRRVGSGTVVAEQISEAAPFARSRPGANAPSTLRVPAAGGLSDRGKVVAEAGEEASASLCTVRPSTPTLEHFPWKRWARLQARIARQSGNAHLAAADPLGLEVLREQIAHHVSLSRGLRAKPSQVVVVSSAQQAIDLCARMLLDPGDEAFIENPGYLNARAALLSAGARLVPVPIDDEGASVEALEAHRGRKTPRLLYVTPSHQFPLGVVMSLARRLHVLAWAAARGAWILEDDYDSEFRYTGRPLAALHGLDTSGRVIYIGTFNKVLFPGLRLAYVIVPEELAPAFGAARRFADGFSPTLQQAALAEFMAGGQFAAYLRQARQHYAACRTALVEEVHRSWGDLATLGQTCTGLHTVARLGGGADDFALAEAGRALVLPTLGVDPLSRFYLGRRKERGLLVSFGASSPDAVRGAIRRLGPLVQRSVSGTIVNA